MGEDERVPDRKASMGKPTAVDPPKRGRPRSERAREAILAAAAEMLLARGLVAVSMESVAERAGVSKATIYRWWPTKEALALDALYHDWDVTAGVPDTGSLRRDLLALLRPWARLVSSRPYAPVIGMLVAKANTDPAFAEEYMTRLVKPRRDRARAIFERAIERGEIGGGIPVAVAIDLLYGPIYHRLLHGHARITDRFVGDVVDMVVHAVIGLTANGGGKPSP
jgi:AcrR family transcriptional regulator